MDTIVENNNVQVEVDSRNHLKGNGLSILNAQRDPDRTSDSYAQTDDLAIVKTLNEAGWFVNNYKQVNAHNKDKAKFRTYLATYTHESGLEIPNEGKLTVLQKGSHDGSKKLVLNLGFFRGICANGMVAGESLLKPVEIKHIGNQPEQLHRLVSQLLTLAPVLLDKVAEFKAIELSNSQAEFFAKQALDFRFGKEVLQDFVTEDGKLVERNIHPVKPSQLLTSLRYEDSGNTLWKVLNRVQERLIKKTNLIGVFEKKVEEEGQATKIVSFNRVISGVKNIDLDLKINTGIWDLAETFRKDLAKTFH
jgi:hypothetical protein